MPAVSRSERTERWAFPAIGLGFLAWIGVFVVTGLSSLVASLLAMTVTPLIMGGAIALCIRWTESDQPRRGAVGNLGGGNNLDQAA